MPPEQKFSSNTVSSVLPIAPRQEKVNLDNWGDSTSGEAGQEFVILYGPPRGGKTFKYFSLIEAAYNLDPNTRAFVCSTERAAFRNLLEFPILDALGIVHMKYTPFIDQVMNKTSQLLGSGQLTSSDWIIIDLASTVWDQFPDYYCRLVLKKGRMDEPGSGYAQLQKEYEDAGGTGNCMLEYYKDGVNPLWNRWDIKLRDSGAHVLLTSAENKVEEDDIKGFKKADKKEVVQLFKTVGTLPAMQKRTPFQYHTILKCDRPYTGKGPYIQTVGERAREYINNGKHTEISFIEKDGMTFGEYYLNKIATWVDKS